MIRIPEALARGTVEREGQRGAAWIAGLPATVDGLLRRWDCEPDGTVLHGGVGVVLPVRRPDGRPAVLKVSFPHPGNVHEPDAFTAWGGRGAVLLYARDDERFAMLLERAGVSSLAEQADGDELVSVAGRLSRRLAVPAPPGLPRLRGHAGRWEEELRADAARWARALAPRALDAAVATVREVGAVQPGTLVHGDLHARNILPGEREPWLAVDPKGYAGDPAYDAGTLLMSRALFLIEADDLGRAAHRVLDVFAEAAGLDRERVRRWARFHAVRAVFRGRRHGFRVAREGARRDRLVGFAGALAELLTHGGRTCRVPRRPCMFVRACGPRRACGAAARGGGDGVSDHAARGGQRSEAPPAGPRTTLSRGSARGGGGQFAGCAAGWVGAAGSPAAVGVGATGSLPPVCDSAWRSRRCPLARTGMATRKVAAPR